MLQAETLLAPNVALLAQVATGAVLVPDSIATLIRTLVVSGELRIVYVPAP
jgi:hypothetical protein